MQHFSLEIATLKDLIDLIQISKKTFYETFALHNNEAEMQVYLAKNFNEANLTAQLANPDSLFYLAKDGNDVVGYLKLNTANAQTELREPYSLEIERIYVLASYHGKQVGQVLYQKAIAVAVEQQKLSIWLGVWEENERAIRFYKKNGFVTFGQHDFFLGNEKQKDLLMRKTL